MPNMARLTRKEDGVIVWVNLDLVETCTRAGDATRLDMAAIARKSHYIVAEPPEAIYVDCRDRFRQ